MEQSPQQTLIAQIDTLPVPDGSLAIWHLGQMGVVVKGGGQVIYIDPCLSDVVAERVPAQAATFGRAFPPPLLPEQIRNADFVLCSHEHMDHTDPLTLGPLAAAAPQARFVVSGWAQRMLTDAGIAPERVTVPPTDAPIQLGSATLWALPAAHYTLEQDAARGHRWLSFLLQLNGVTFFHGGDTLIYPGQLERLRALPRADIALIACNGRDAIRDAQNITGNLWPDEAVWLAGQLGWDVLLGGHNDLYPANTIAPGAFAEALARYGPRQKGHVLQPGELYMYVRG